MSYTKRQLDSIAKLVEEHKEISQHISELTASLDAVKAKLMEKLEANELETLTIGEEGEEVKVTIVRPTTLKVDEVGLEKALTFNQWANITKVVVDKKALEDSVVRGMIDAATVAQHTKEVASRPYLRITG